MAGALHSLRMLEDGKYPLPTEPDGFPARLRQVINSYGSTSALARHIDRSEGAVRKWLRGQSEPSVSDLRAICEVTQTSVEWLVMGRGEQKGMAVREPPVSSGGEEPLPPLNYKLMDDVVLTIRLESKVAGAVVTPEKCSSILTTVYNMSRATRQVDREGAERIIALAS
jgi:transcriptional regulator with XRE-family HTH domain